MTTPLFTPAALIVAFTPTRVIARVTVIGPGYVPGQTMMVVPGDAALMAEGMREKAAVVQEVSAADATALGDTYNVVADAAPPATESGTVDASTSTATPNHVRGLLIARRDDVVVPSNAKSSCCFIFPSLCVRFASADQYPPKAPFIDRPVS
jgi:hypothetical protein